MEPVDERVLDALRAEYGTTITSQAIRRAMRDAARANGIDVDSFEREAAAAA